MKKKVIGILTILILSISGLVYAAYTDTESEDDLNLVEEATEVEEVEAEDDWEDYELYDDNLTYESEIIYDDVYKMGDDITINEIIDANVYVMGDNVKIDGATIYGNLYVMAKNIEITNAEVDGSIYAMGNKISYLGMANDLYAIGNDVEVVEEGYIWRNIKVVSDNFVMNGNCSRNVSATVNNITVGDTATISGKLDYSADSNANISDSAQVVESNVIADENNEDEDTTDSKGVSSYIYGIASVAFRTLIIALILVFLINKFKEIKRTENIATDVLKEAGIGFGVLVLLPVISIILICTVLGIGFGFAGLAIYAIALYIATSVASVEIAQRILDKVDKETVKKGKLIGISILVSLVVWVIKFIPVLGALVRFIVLLMGLGVIFNLVFQNTQKEKIK